VESSQRIANIPCGVGCSPIEASFAFVSAANFRYRRLLRDDQRGRVSKTTFSRKGSFRLEFTDVEDYQGRCDDIHEIIVQVKGVGVVCAPMQKKKEVSVAATHNQHARGRMRQLTRAGKDGSDCGRW